MKSWSGVFSILILLMITSDYPCFASPIDCSRQDMRGRRVCEEREKVIEHEKVFVEKIITYELVETAPDEVESTNSGSPASDGHTSPPVKEKIRPPHSVPRDHHLTCITEQDYSKISKLIDGGRSGSTGNGYHDKLMRYGRISPDTREIWIGNRVARICTNNSGRDNGGRQKTGGTNWRPADTANNSTDLQEMFASPTEAATFSWIPVESIRTWTETWYETIIEQFCWWVPGDAIIDPVTLDPVKGDLASLDPGSGQEPVPEPATLFLFGSALVVLPILKRRFFG